jgi:hypothetical protein
MRSLLACSALLLLPLSALAADAPNCKFTAARALKLDVAGAKTVVFEVNQHDLKVVASAGGRPARNGWTSWYWSSARWATSWW